MTRCSECFYQDLIHEYKDGEYRYICGKSKIQFKEHLEGTKGICRSFYSFNQYEADEAAKEQRKWDKRIATLWAISDYFEGVEESNKDNEIQEQHSGEECYEPREYVRFLLCIALAVIAYNWGITGMRFYGIFLVALFLLVCAGIVSYSYDNILGIKLHGFNLHGTQTNEYEEIDFDHSDDPLLIKGLRKLYSIIKWTLLLVVFIILLVVLIVPVLYSTSFFTVLFTCLFSIYLATEKAD